MKTKLSILVWAFLPLWLAQNSAWAQAISCPEIEEREVSPGALTEQTYNRLSRIFEDIGEENYSSAEKAATAMLDRVREDYERSEVLLALTVIRGQQGRHDEALRYVREIIDLNALPNDRHYDMMFQAAQIYIMQEQWREGLQAWEEWYCAVPEEKVTSSAWLFKAQAHAQLNEFRQAIEAVDQTIALSDSPKEQWYQFKMGMHMELNEFSQAGEVCRILINMNPAKKTYWTSLMAIYMEIGDDARALDTMVLAYRNGLLDSQTEYLQLASLYQSQNVPYKAANVMQTAIEDGIVEPTRRHWEIVAGAWTQAREMERALDAFERAGRQAGDGKVDLQRGHILLSREEWSEARGAARRAIEKGGLSGSEQGNAYLLIGMSEYELNNLTAAEQAFNQASNFGRTRSPAQQWLRQIRQGREAPSARAAAGADADDSDQEDTGENDDAESAEDENESEGTEDETGAGDDDNDNA